MNVALHDAEMEYVKHKSFPNLALMKLAAWHKKQGDLVEWWNPLFTYDRVYSSKVFDFTPEDLYLPDHTIRGGTGYRDISINQGLPEEIDWMYPDYTLYADCDYAIGYITRGCPNQCRWCVVPQKEGGIKPYREWRELVREDTNKILLMDNNILASDFGIEQLIGMIGSGYRIDLNQGMDARLLTEEIAQILSRLSWIRFLRFSCDTKLQIKSVCKAIESLRKYGVKPYRISVYLLVTEDLADAEERVLALKRFHCLSIYAQAERNERLGIIPNQEQLEYTQRYIYGRCYVKETWEEYCKRKNLKFDKKE